MQPIVIDKPYSFVPPRYSAFWHGLARAALKRNLRKEYGISEVECIGAEKLRASLAAGHGIMLPTNHCRPCDPMIMDYLAKEVGRPFHVIANWHLFMGGRFRRFLLQRIGAFSVHREGMDRESLKCCVNTVAEGKHPLIIFAEGIITRCNDRLLDFMEGPAFIARAAAKQRPQGKVVAHPVFIRYFFEGELESAVIPVLEEIERRFSWQPQSQLPLQERILKAGSALLGLKETEYLGAPQTGTFRERLDRLIDRLLRPLEDRWTPGRHDGGTMNRVKRLRTAIVPELTHGDLSKKERVDRWRQLADLYLVQQLYCYPGDYIESPTPERVLETVERYEEDLTDVARPHFPLRVVITVGDAIEVPATRDRSADADPLTTAIREQMEAMMESSKAARRALP